MLCLKTAFVHKQTIYMVEGGNAKNDTDKKFTANPHLELYVALNVFLFIFSVGSFCFLSVEKSYGLAVFNIVLAVIIPLTFIAVFIYTTFSGWNGVVTFDNEKASQKRWGKTVEWRWDDLSNIGCRTHMPWLLRGFNFWPLFTVSSNSHGKILVFTLNPQVNERFAELCNNEKVTRKFNELVLSCDFPGKYDGRNLNIAESEKANAKISAGYIIHNILLLIIGVAGVIFYIKEIAVGYIICFSVLGILLITEFILYLINRLKTGRR